MSRYTDPTNPETVVERCICEYVDIGIGHMRVVPDPECPAHGVDADREVRDGAR